MALLKCVALGGHHSLASYQWSQDGKIMMGEAYPLCYTTAVGQYTCTVTCSGKSVERSFEVKGMNSLNCTEVLLA